MKTIFLQRIPTNSCGNCRLSLRPGDRVITAFIINSFIQKDTAIKDVMGLLSKCDFELVHASCEYPSLSRDEVPVTVRRVDYNTCANCRKPIFPTHRITSAFIVQGVAVNPQMPMHGEMAILSPEVELVHINCNDPDLAGMPLPGHKLVI